MVVYGYYKRGRPTEGGSVIRMITVVQEGKSLVQNMTLHKKTLTLHSNRTLI